MRALRGRRILRVTTRGTPVSPFKSGAHLFHARFSGFRLGHVITATRADFKSFLFAFSIAGFHAQNQFMHASVISFIFTERKPEAVASVEITDHAGQAGAIIFDATDVYSFTPALLSQLLPAAGDAEASPTNQRLAERQQELVERPHVNIQIIKDRVLS